MNLQTSGNPDSIATWHGEAQRLLARGELARARQYCLRILQQDRRHADAHFLLGMIATSLNRPGDALELVRKAVDLDPTRAEYLAQLARCQIVLRRQNEALASVDRALELEPGEALTLDTLGVVLSHLGDHRRAAETFRRAADLAPSSPGYQFNLASSLKFLGDFDGAEAAYEAAARADPHYYRVYPPLAQLRRQTPERNHVERLEALLAEVGGDVDGELQLRHALAKEYEDLGEPARAFEHLCAGKARKRRQLDYDGAADQAVFEALREAFPSGTPWPAEDEQRGREAIFVVGMPRTGTTLVDRILSAHSRVQSAGELQDFGLAVKRAAATASGRVLDPATVAAARRADTAAVGRAYLDSARRTVPGAGRFIDKLPLNFLYLGFIRLALPGARLVCLRRHPLDTILSNFRQLFAIRFSYYDYAYDLEDTARYYVLFHRLMEHWDSVMPGRILQLRYESLVADQPGQTHRLLEHCGLEWEDACLSFERNTAPVATASAVQVREPLHDRAAGRWRQYAAQLEPARRILEAAGIVAD